MMCDNGRGGVVAVNEAFAKKDGKAKDYNRREGEKKTLAPNNAGTCFFKRGDVHVGAIVLQQRKQFIDRLPI